jgi:tropomodulin
MATTKIPNENVNMDDFESLLATLNAEELENINDLVDPENSYLPASDRCKPQTNKAPTGPYDRNKLLGFIAEQGKSEKDWEEQKPHVPGEKKGKVWQPPEVTKSTEGEDQEFTASTEWDDVLTNASENEIVELAAILGFTGLINQVQYHAAVLDKISSANAGGWNGRMNRNSIV